MKLVSLITLDKNQTVIYTDKAKIFFSYNTPVCAYVFGKGWIKTDRFYSISTSKHINGYIESNVAMVVPQSEIDTLLSA